MVREKEGLVRAELDRMLLERPQSLEWGEACGSEGAAQRQHRSPTGESGSISVQHKKVSKKLNCTIGHQSTNRGAQPSTSSDQKSFSSNSAVHQKKSHVCADCGKSFNCRSSLSRHERIHKEVKNYSCPDCGKKFREYLHLASHQTIHTGERAYQCPDCDKSFRLKGVLCTHRKTHTGAKPFKCTECGQGFGRKETLHKHMRTHTGDSQPKHPHGS
uniref:C2H2-type domain-containing protein n=1 Tax=Chrysemys picta bellii TaxID=8478 RepID=A0A8C3HK37_CHRPI